MMLPICRTDSLPVPERMPGTCRVSEVSRQASELIWRFSCSRPLIPKLLITAPDEHGRILLSPGTGV